MLLLGLDVETTGLSAERDRIIEIGAVLWETECNQPVKIYSEMILEPSLTGVSKEIEEITGLNFELLRRFGVAPEGRLFADLAWMMERAAYFVAHNAPFDRGFLTNFFHRYEQSFPDKPWIDSLQDIEYPAKLKGRNLTYLAAEHGFLNPFPHRAVTDVLTLFKVLSHYPIAEIAQQAAAPTLEVTALVSYEDRNKAKEAGFRWDGAQKKWKRSMKKPLFDPKKYDFPVEVVELG